MLQARVKIIESDGRDVTTYYQLVAWVALEAAHTVGCEAALLTDGSPTYGSRTIYKGLFRGQKKAGHGVAVTLPHQYGIRVFAQEEIDELTFWINEKEKKNDPL